MILYHRTYRHNAEAIVKDGFRDAVGTYPLPTASGQAYGCPTSRWTRTRGPTGTCFLKSPATFLA